MAKLERREPRNRQRLSRKTKKALVNSIGREQFHEHMAELSHDSSRIAKAELFARVAQQPYSIKSGRVQRLLAYSSLHSMK